MCLNVITGDLKVMAPNDFQGTIIGGINKRTGVIQNSDMSEDGSGCVVQADVPLAQVRALSNVSDGNRNIKPSGVMVGVHRHHWDVSPPFDFCAAPT